MNVRQILIILAFLTMVTVNGLANALPINGIETGAISDQFPVLFTPAGYVFAIWGVIYLLLAAYAVYQALPAQRNNKRLANIGGWFIANALLNSLWIFLWHYGFFVLTVLVMLGILGTLIVIYLRLNRRGESLSWKEKVFANLPFSVYLGWISVATIANITVMLYDLNWSAFNIPGEVWTVALLLIATVLGTVMTLANRDKGYTLVLVWAFVGIFVKQSPTPVVAYTALGLAILLAVLVVLQIIREILASRSVNNPVRSQA